MLSKSDYLLYLKHPAWLWLKKHDKGKLTPVSDNLQAVFDTGHLFEKYAESLFSGGVTVGFNDYQDYRTQPERTKKVFDNGAKVVFQGRFEAGGLTCIADIVVKNDDGSVDLYEIKSGTDAKLIYEHDLAFQLVVLEASGYKVRSVKLLCVNSEYVRMGDIDSKQFVLEQDITNVVMEKRQDTKEHIEKASKVVALSTMPDIAPSHAGFGALKEWITIYRTLTSVEEGSIYDLCRLNVELIEELEKRQIRQVKDIPDDVGLKSQQFLQVQVTRENKPKIDSNEIKRFLSQLTYPLYFLDYETLSSVVPPFDGLKPYQQVPFQYSLHVIESPGADLKQFGYLHNTNTNPVSSLTESLQSHIGETGTIFVWYEAFEKSRNVEMGDLEPQFRKFYKQINDRVVDLMTPFSSGWYAHKDFLGSASIKHVLPVLVPELSYKDLEIGEGNTAQRLWMETVLDGKHISDRENIFHNLDTYCALDTLAMVKIYEKLVEVMD